MAIQTLRAERPGDAARLKQVSFPAHSDKRSRAQVLADRAKNRRVFIQRCDLAGQFIREHVRFPDEHDDCVDVTSVATHHFGLQGEFSAAIADAEAGARRRAFEVARRQAAYERVGVYGAVGA